MGVTAIVNAFVYVDACDFTGAADELVVRAEAETRERTTLRNNGWRRHANTLKASTVSTNGFWSSDSAADVDPTLFDQLGLDSGITAGMAEVEGELCHFMLQMQTEYTTPEGSVGDLGRYRLNSVGGGAHSHHGQIRGKLFKAYGSGAVTSATGPIGTAIQLGAVPADKKLYGLLHLFGTPGSSITVVAQSDNAVGFPSPTNVATFNGGAITTAGKFWLTPMSGAITDDWWRLNVTAITGDWVIAGSLGIR